MGFRQTVGNTVLKWGATILGERDAFYSLTDPRLASVFRGKSFFQGFGSTTPQWLTMNMPDDYVGAWEKCPPLVSIICNKAQADINGRVAFYRVGSDKEVRPDGYNKQVRDLAALFSKPNPLQTWRQFRAQQKIYTQLFGICPVLMVKPVGFDMPKMMYNIPPHLVKIETSGKLYYQSEANNIITKITVTIAGRDMPLPVEDVVFLRDQTISLNSEVLPDSRLKTLSYPVSNIIACYEAENVVVTKKGPMGIFSNAGKDKDGVIPVTPEEKADLQQSLQQYGLSHAQYQYVITTAALQFQQVGANIKELMLLEIIKDCTQQLCDVYGFPYELLSDDKGVTFANKAEAKASLYQDTIIPEAAADMEVFNGYFQLSAQGYEARLVYDHIEVLQQSEKEKAEGMKATSEACLIEWQNGKLTLNEWQEQLGKPALTGEQFNMYKPQYDQWLRDNELLPPMIDPNKPKEDEEPTA